MILCELIEFGALYRRDMSVSIGEGKKTFNFLKC